MQKTPCCLEHAAPQGPGKEGVSNVQLAAQNLLYPMGCSSSYNLARHEKQGQQRQGSTSLCDQHTCTGPSALLLHGTTHMQPRLLTAAVQGYGSFAVPGHVYQAQTFGACSHSSRCRHVMP